MVATGIVKIGIGIAAVILVIYFIRQIQGGKFILEGVQGTSQFFSDLKGSIDSLNPFANDERPEDKKSSLADSTVTLEDGSKINIPSDTEVQEDGTVTSSTPPEIELPTEVEERVKTEFARTKRLNERNKEIASKLDEEQLKELSSIQSELLELEPIRDTQGFNARFTTPIGVQNRILQQLLQKKKGNSTLRDKDGKIIEIDVESAFQRQKRLLEEIEKSREQNPEFFKEFDARVSA